MRRFLGIAGDASAASRVLHILKFQYMRCFVLIRRTHGLAQGIPRCRGTFLSRPWCEGRPMARSASLLEMNSSAMSSQTGCRHGPGQPASLEVDAGQDRHHASFQASPVAAGPSFLQADLGVLAEGQRLLSSVNSGAADSALRSRGPNQQNEPATIGQFVPPIFRLCRANPDVGERHQGFAIGNRRSVGKFRDPDSFLNPADPLNPVERG